ncbi:MAG: hypothetical protein HOP33_12855 [Verrucomicrobia bacterium]|nr:hypothetical protein [Verrucomicrobiota bacterium]
MKKTGKQILVRLGLIALCLIATPIILFLIWRIRLANEVNSRLATIRAAGLPTSGAEVNSHHPPVVDTENSALVMTQAFALMIEFTGQRSNEIAQFEMPSRLQPLTDKQVALLADYVLMNSNALVKAESALTLTESHYPVNFSAALYALFPHLQKLRNLAQIEEFRSALAIHNGQFTEATEALVNMPKMAATLDEESTVIAQLVRARILEMTFRLFERRANTSNFDANELTAFAAALPVSERTNALAKSLVWDRALLMPYFRGSWSQISPILNPSAAPVDAADLTLESGHQSMFIRASGFYERDLLLYMHAMETNIARAVLPPPQCLTAKQSNDRAAEVARQRLCILSAVFLPSYSKIIDRSVENTARMRLANAAIAIERFHMANGRFPRSLAEIIPNYAQITPTDPFNGEPLRYKSLDNGYQIYSVGKDGGDDGGREKPPSKKATDQTPYDITFTVER